MNHSDDLFTINSIKGRTNQAHPDNLGLGANANPWATNDSASRAQMIASHLGQIPPIADGDIRRTLTGTERELGSYTFKHKMLEDGVIQFVIDKYPNSHIDRRFRTNPQKLVVYRGICADQRYSNSPYYGVLDITSYHTMHQYFGFMFKPVGNRMDMLRENEAIDADTVFCQSPTLDEHGNYKIGVRSRTLFASLHTTIEDGMLAERTWLERFTSTGIEIRTESWGAKCYPINKYGDRHTYKAHPDLGERIGDDGILFAMREYDTLLAVVEMTPQALMEPDFIFDRLVYGKPNAEIIDVTVYHDHNLNRSPTPVGIEQQANKYYEAHQKQQSKLIELYENLKRKHGEKLVLHPNLHRMIVDAYAFTKHPSVPGSAQPKVGLTYRRAPLDDFRTEIVFKYDIVPSIGSKVTDLHGGKGVIVEIREKEDMPTWPDGTYAELVRDNDSPTKRMNLGAPFEQATCAVCRQLTDRVRSIMANENVPKAERYEQAYIELMEFYSIASHFMHDFMLQIIDTEGKRHGHVDAVVKDGIYLYLPPHTDNIGADAIEQLRTRYGIEMHPVTYRAANGKMVTTKEPMLIAEMYVVMLEKNGFDWSAVASPKRQHFGILARMTNMDKHSSPGRENAVRITGEAEIRLALCLLPDFVVADLLDRPNNPIAHKQEVRSIIEAENPAVIELAVDRSKIPLGGNRAVQFIKHIMRCCGIALRRWKES